LFNNFNVCKEQFFHPVFSRVLLIRYFSAEREEQVPSTEPTGFSKAVVKFKPDLKKSADMN